MADLEPTSQMDDPVDPPGQTRYVSRPDPTLVTNAIIAAKVGASIESTGNITFNLTINGGNQTLRARLKNSGAFTVILIPTGVYTNAASLVAAMNTVLAPVGMGAQVSPSFPLRIDLFSLTYGPGSYIEIDTTGNGSTFNTPAVFAAGGSNFTVPSATTLITAFLPVGGPLDVRLATLETNIGPMVTAAMGKIIANAIAPQFVETDVAIKSFEVGMMKGYLSASYTPDPSRKPALPTGAAITVVQDDGNTLFTAPVPNISGAAHNSPNGGDITITGTGLANAEDDLTSVHVTSADGSKFVHLVQKIIRTTVSGGTTGSVSATSIVIPASLLAGLGVAGSKVQVQYTSLASNAFTVT
jgi:hypothetical protein